MPIVRVSIQLPYHLMIPDGSYPCGTEGTVMLSEMRASDDEAPGEAWTCAQADFAAVEDLNGEEAERIADREANRLLRRVNRLLRWYRLLASTPTILEITRAQASPFHFTLAQTQNAWLVPLLEFERGDLPPAEFRSLGELGDALRRHLSSGEDPEVARLNLLDAEFALSVGRFRESVLLCWSVIDSVFVRKFSALVDATLAVEWGDAREFLKGFDFGLRHKMTSGLRLVAGRSLFEEPDDFWEVLSGSYNRRNQIVHAGAGASEDDAVRALGVVRRIVHLANEL